MVIEIDDDFLRILTGCGPGTPLEAAVKNYIYGVPDNENRRLILGDVLIKRLEAALANHRQTA